MKVAAYRARAIPACNAYRAGSLYAMHTGLVSFVRIKQFSAAKWNKPLNEEFRAEIKEN